MNWPHEPLEAGFMVKSRPLFLLVATLVLVMLALGMFWYAILPQHLLAQVTGNLKSTQGLALEAHAPKLRFANGLVLQLEDVALTQDDMTVVSAQTVNIGLSPVAFFGGGMEGDEVELQSPIFTVELRGGLGKLPLGIRRMTWRDGILRLKDKTHKSVVAIADVNGQFTRNSDGAGTLSASFILNNRLSTLAADIADVGRVTRDGSPVDMVLASNGQTLSVSGRLKADETLAVDGQLLVQSAGAAELLAWLGTPLQSLPATGQLTGEAGISTQGLEASFNKLKLITKDHVLGGELTIHAGPDKTAVKGELTLNSISLWPNANVLALPWPETELPIDDFFAADVDLKVLVEKLDLRGVDVGSVLMEAQHTNGALSLKLGEGLSAQVTQHRGDVKIDATINAISIAAEKWTKALLGTVLFEGAVDVNAKLSASGKHWAGMVSTLQGEFVAEATKAAFNIDLAAHGKATSGGWKPGKTSASLNLKTRLAEGVALLDGSTLRHTDVTFAPKGEVDLLRQAFDLSLNPRGKTTDKDLRLTGRWLDPRFASGATPALRLPGSGAPAPAAN
jgi:hypothetical protein